MFVSSFYVNAAKIAFFITRLLQIFEICIFAALNRIIFQRNRNRVDVDVSQNIGQ